MKSAIGVIVLLSTIVVTPAVTQRWDPDWCLTCRDSREHFLAGGGISAATRLVFQTSRTWQRLAVCGTIALAYELGQEGVARSAGVSGRGYGIGPKDWLLTVAGCAAVEFLWPGKP